VPSWGQAVKGDEAFADRVLQRVGEPRVVSRDLTVEVIARRVAKAEGVDVEQMRRSGQGRKESEARLITAWLGREVGRISTAKAAKYFGRDTSTIARGLVRLEERMDSDRALRDRVSRLSKQVRP